MCVCVRGVFEMSLLQLKRKFFFLFLFFILKKGQKKTQHKTGFSEMLYHYEKNNRIADLRNAHGK